MRTFSLHSRYCILALFTVLALPVVAGDNRTEAPTQTETVDPFASDPFTSDPFAQDPFTSDPFANSDDKPTQSEQSQQELAQNGSFWRDASHFSRIELKQYFQLNSRRDDHAFNPDLLSFPGHSWQATIDASVDSRWNDHWRSSVRWLTRWRGAEQSNTGEPESEIDGDVITANISYSKNAWLVEAGRIKPQWSKGYNWDIANVLLPMRNRPYIDQDNPLQSKGWDMLGVHYMIGDWTISGYAIDSDKEDYRGAESSLQAVMRVAYQGDISASFLIQHIDGVDPVFAATLSTLLNDETTFRAEWSAHPIRQLAQPELIHAESYYHRFVLGGTYTAPAGWSLTAEYFNNQHGFSQSEWESFRETTVSAAARIEQQMPQPTDYVDTFASLTVLGTGWLRQQYASLMFMSAETRSLWQYRLSTLVNVDDSSQLYRAEVMKSFGSHLVTRFQYEYFNGCDQCEYGLNPNTQTTRVVVSWLF